jgi:multidrug resistance protein, MATE family
MACMSAVLLAAPAFFAGLFLDAGTSSGAQAIDLAVALLLVVAAFQIADGAQVIGIQALRGLNDTTTPMFIAGFGYWAVGCGMAYVLGFPAGFGPVGVWSGMAIGLAIVAALMLGRFALLTRRDVLPRIMAGLV